MSRWRDVVAAVRRANSFEGTGSFGANESRHDDLVQEYVDLMAEMERLPARVRRAGRMAVEGWHSREIASACRVSMRTVARDREAFREWLLYRARRSRP